MKMVRNKDNPIIIWLGGLCMVPKALRRRESTITILVNDVSIIRIAGARESTVKRRKICKTTATSPGLPALSKPMFMNGREGAEPAPQQTWQLKQTKSRVIPETVNNNLNGLITILLHYATVKLVPGQIFAVGIHDYLPLLYLAENFCN